MDVTDYLSMYKCTAKELGQRMMDEVFRETGIQATCGIGTNLYLAKIAMDIVAKHMPADKDGVRIAELDEINTWLNYPNDGKFTIEQPDGNKAVYLRLIDVAGNVSYISSDGMVLDTVPPVITAVPSFTDGAWTTASEVKIDVTSITDVTSGVVPTSITYSYEGINKDPVTVPSTSLGNGNSFTIPNADIPNGEYKIIITATDKAGRQSLSRENQVVLL